MTRTFMAGPPLAILIAAALLIPGCGDDGKKTTQPDDNNNQTPTYTADIQPILQSGCSCHYPGGQMYGGAPLDTYQRAFNLRSRVKARAGVERTMPPAGPLPQTQQNTIIAWVDAGAPE
ncbi:MAG: hypothetical protein FJY88_06860 [Candidatus Eisenbacteria bacterium]|nr:hypothetical protein [Candidatus Eisenbacteria bacterium]